eukprot:g30758.t1
MDWIGDLSLKVPSALPPTRGISRSQHLCQGLVVPSGSECVLAVRLPQGVAWAEAQADVMDLTGRAVLAATLKPGAQASSREPAVVLKPTSTTPNATVANQVLARCYASRGSDGEIGMDICKAWHGFRRRGLHGVLLLCRLQESH